MPIELTETNGRNSEYLQLERELDRELSRRNGEGQKEYDGLNALPEDALVIVLRCDGVPAACGALKKTEEGRAEIKRVFVPELFRRRGFAKRVLDRLEETAKRAGYSHVVLETGKKQIEAIALYILRGYRVIENYGPYRGKENSVCMEKPL